MGTMLFAHGAPPDSCLEELNQTRPSLIAEVHRSYTEAGARVIVTNSFGGNRLRLGRNANRLERLNRAAVRIARQAAACLPVGMGRRVKVFASIGPLGPEGRKLGQPAMIRLFREQVRALARERPDGYLVETMTSLTEAEAAALAIREVSNRTVAVSMTFPRGFSRPKKTVLELIGTTLRSAGADVLGANCGTHPEEVFNFLNEFRLVDPGPWLARPAAGLPTRPVFPAEFAKWGVRLAALGVTYIGGCCNSTPAHIRRLAEISK